jgi:hypothetical protein
MKVSSFFSRINSIYENKHGPNNIQNYCNSNLLAGRHYLSFRRLGAILAFRIIFLKSLTVLLRPEDEESRLPHCKYHNWKTCDEAGGATYQMGGDPRAQDSKGWEEKDYMQNIHEWNEADFLPSFPSSPLCYHTN